MKPVPSDKNAAKKNGYDDDNIRYKLNLAYFNNNAKPVKVVKKPILSGDDDNVRYMFPTVLNKPVDKKYKVKPKIKVNFWSTKQSSNRLHGNETKEKTNRRHTIAVPKELPPPKLKNSVKVRKRVSFLPSPLFSDNHVPMVTVPDDLTIQLNEEEANDLGEDLNLAFVNDAANSISLKVKAKSSTTQTSPKGTKRKRNSEDTGPRFGNENELEFFSKYVVQKLRKMETNQRIYSENLINTVLMLGQLGKLNGKSKIGEA